MLLREGALRCVRSLKLTTTTIPYVNPDAMVHVLLTLNEPLLQRRRCTWSPWSVPHHKHANFFASVWTGFRSRRELYDLLVLICVPNPPRLVLSASLNKMPLLRSALPSSPHRGHDTDAAIQMTRVGTKTLLLVSGMEGWACTTECKGRRYVDVGSSCVRRRARGR